MATVTSLSEQRILELAAGWQGVAGTQAVTEAELTLIKQSLANNNAAVDDLTNNKMPALQEALAADNVVIANLNDTVIPTLRADLTGVDAAVVDIQAITLPNLQGDLDSVSINSNLRPKTFWSDVPPVDEEDGSRPLQVSDVWYNTTNGENIQSIWNGVEWSTFTVGIADFSLTVKKLLSTTHMIY